MSNMEKEEVETMLRYLTERVKELTEKVKIAEYERSQALIMRNLYEQLLKRWGK